MTVEARPTRLRNLHPVADAGPQKPGATEQER